MTQIQMDDDGGLSSETEALSDEIIEKVKDAVRPYLEAAMKGRDLVEFCEYVGIHAGVQLQNELFRMRCQRGDEATESTTSKG